MANHLDVVLKLTAEMQDAVESESWDLLPQLQQQRNIFITDMVKHSDEVGQQEQRGELLKRLYRTNQQLVGTMKEKLKHTSVMASQANKGGKATRAYLAV